MSDSLRAVGDRSLLWSMWLRSLQLAPRRARWKPATRLFKPRSPTSVAVQLRSGLVMRLDMSDETQRAMGAGAFEYDTFDVTSSILQPGDCVIDVGANIGLHSLTWGMKLGSEGRVMAFEPAPPNYEVLLRNLALNPGIDCVEPYNLALGDACGDISIKAVEDRTGLTHGGYSATGAGDGFQVKQEPLDEVLGRLDRSGPVKLIKVDVEGWEARVLTGAIETIREHRPHLVIEWNRDYASEELRTLVWGSIVEPLGYHAGRIDRTKIAGRGRVRELTADWRSWPALCNLYLVPQDA